MVSIGYCHHRGYCDGKHITTMHAEHHAIRNYIKKGGKIKNIRLYVVRLDRKGKLRMSKPCKKCQKLIDFHNIKKVHYSTNEGTIVNA